MFVNNLTLLEKDLITITPKETIGKALEILKENNFLSIPVVEDSKFYGVISKEKIYAYYYDKCIDKKCLLSDFLVENVMRTDVPIIDPMQQIEEAVEFLETRRVSFVAVVNSDGKFEGIVTHNVIFHQFTELFGVNQGRRLAVIAHDVQGQISRLTKVITENKGDIISLVVVDLKSLTKVKEIILRLKTSNFEGIVAKVKAAGFNVE